jgi:hypothetical protein
MEGSDRRWGWIVIAVGALILGYVLGSHGNRQPSIVYVSPPNAQVAPAMPVMPGQPVAPDGPQFRHGRGFQGPGWQQGGPQFGPGWRGHRPFFMPFMFLGGLLKLGLLALLVFWIARRWRGGPPWARRWHEDRPSDKQPPSPPASTPPSGEGSQGGEDSGYTGGTTKL